VKLIKNAAATGRKKKMSSVPKAGAKKKYGV